MVHSSHFNSKRAHAAGALSFIITRKMRHKSSLFSFIIRVIALLLYLVITLPLVWLMVPLRLLHPILRKLGLPHLLPMDLVQKYWTRGMVILAGVKVRREGLDRIKKYKGKAMVYMFSHASNLDVRATFIVALR